MQNTPPQPLSLLSQSLAAHHDKQQLFAIEKQSPVVQPPSSLSSSSLMPTPTPTPAPSPVADSAADPTPIPKRALLLQILARVIKNILIAAVVILVGAAIGATVFGGLGIVLGILTAMIKGLSMLNTIAAFATLGAGTGTFVGAIGLFSYFREMKNKNYHAAPSPSKPPDSPSFPQESYIAMRQRIGRIFERRLPLSLETTPSSSLQLEAPIRSLPSSLQSSQPGSPSASPLSTPPSSPQASPRPTFD